MEEEKGDADGAGTSSAPVHCAITPFPPPPVPVHVLDKDGNVFPARVRSLQDDFREAVRSLELGRAPAADGDGVGDKGAEDKDGGDDGGGGEKPGHPLEPCLHALGMAQSELNQLVNLLTMAQAGSYVRLTRGAKMVPAGGRQAQAGGAGGGGGQQKTALAAGSPAMLLRARRHQLLQASGKLRECMADMRGTAASRRAFEAGIAALRKNWRLVASGRSAQQAARPLTVGEPLAVDCSATSRPAASPTATDHHHKQQPQQQAPVGAEPRWLVPLECDDTGAGVRLAPGHPHPATLRTLVVEVYGGGGRGSVRRCLARTAACADLSSDVSSEFVAGTGGDPSLGGLAELERYLRAVQHSAGCEAVLEAARAEALQAAAEWLDAAGSDDIDGGSASDGAAACGDAGSGAQQRQPGRKRPRGTADGGGGGGAGGALRVACVFEDEVEVQLDAEHTLVIALRPAAAEAAAAAAAAAASAAAAAASAAAAAAAGTQQGDVAVGGGGAAAEHATEVDGPAGGEGEQLVAAEPGAAEAMDVQLVQQHEGAGSGAPLLSVLCRLALLHLSMLVHVAERRSGGSGHSAAGAAGGVAGGTRQQAASPRQQQPPKAAPAVLHQVMRLVQHHIFREQVCTALSQLAEDISPLGLHSHVQWTHVELQDARSRATVSLSRRFHFVLALEGPSATLESLPGSRGFGASYQRSIPAHSREELSATLRGEVARQVTAAIARAATQRAHDVNTAAGFSAGRCMVQSHVYTGVVRVLAVRDSGTIGGGGGDMANDMDDDGASGGSPPEVLVTVSCAADAVGGGSLAPVPIGVRCVAHSAVAAEQLQAADVPCSEGPEGVVARWEEAPGKDVLSKLKTVLHALLPLPAPAAAAVS